MTNVRVIFIASIVIGVLLASGCGKASHSITCVAVNDQRVCFVREVWARSGYRVALTTSTDVCHQPSAETDFVSDPGAGNVYYKIDHGTLHIYGVGRMKRPTKAFPVAVEFGDLMNPGEADLRSSGYSQLLFGETTWCLSDLK